MEHRPAAAARPGRRVGLSARASATARRDQAALVLSRQCEAAALALRGDVAAQERRATAAEAAAAREREACEARGLAVSRLEAECRQLQAQLTAAAAAPPLAQTVTQTALLAEQTAEASRRSTELAKVQQQLITSRTELSAARAELVAGREAATRTAAEHAATAGQLRAQLAALGSAKDAAERSAAERGAAASSAEARLAAAAATSSTASAASLAQLEAMSRRAVTAECSLADAHSTLPARPLAVAPSCTSAPPRLRSCCSPSSRTESRPAGSDSSERKSDWGRSETCGMVVFRLVYE